MAVTRSRNGRPGTWRRHALLAAALAALLLAAAVRAEDAPEPAAASPDPEAALERAAGMNRQLDLLRFAGEPAPIQVAVHVKEGLAALSAADAALKQQLAQVAPPAKKPLAAVSREAVDKVARLRTGRCRIAVAHAELCHYAAAALPESHTDHARYLNEAIATFRALRVDYCDLGLGMMGFVGEARSQRLAGNAAAAKAALQPVLQTPLAPKNPASAALRRVALLEDLEATFLATPEEAPATVAALRKAPEFKGEAAWQARLDYMDARIGTALAEDPPIKEVDPAIRAARIARAAATLRSDAVVSATPNRDRLALLVKLDGLAGGKLLKREEILEWADLALAAGRTDVMPLYERAKATTGAPLSAKQLMSYVAVAMAQDRPLAAAYACDQVLPSLTAADPQRPAVLQVRAAALARVLRQTRGGPPSLDLADRTLAALKAVVESPSPEAVRTDALRQWTALRSGRSGPQAASALLVAHRGLVEKDAYLLYAWAAGRWEELSENPEMGAAEARARDIVADLEKVPGLATTEEGKTVLAASALLHARALAGSPLKDLRAALRALDADQAALQADPAVAGAAAWLRAEVLLGLGMADEASKALAQVPEGAGGGSPVVRLRLAEALAARYGDIAKEGREEARRRVLELTAAAVAGAKPGAEATSVSLKAAKCLIAAEANAEAQALLEKVLASEAARKDVTVMQRASLLLAEALVQGGQAAQAATLLDRLAGEFPRSAEIHMARGRCQAGLAQHAQAIESFRTARGLCIPGAADWCRATLALAESQAAANQAGTASDVLRVAEALYPDFGGPALQSQLRQSRARLGVRHD